MSLSLALKKQLEDNLFLKPSQFVHYFKLPPYPHVLSEDQKNFIDDMADLSLRRAILCAPRGSGKTFILACLFTWSISELPKILGEPYKVCVLGGKYQQAQKLHNFCSSWFLNIPYLRAQLKKDPIKGHILKKDGSEIVALAASDRSVHGPHSDVLGIDEAVDAPDPLIGEAECIIATSKHPRLIYTSTPYRYLSKFVDTWKNAGILGFKKYHFKVENCSWLNKKEFEHAKAHWSEDRFRIHWLGLPTVFSSIVFEPELLHDNTPEEMPELIEGARRVMGIDFGYGPSPTAIVVCILIDNIWYVIYAEEFIKRTPDWIQHKIGEIAKEFEVNDIFGDAQAKSEIMRLRDVSVPVMSIAFQYKRESDMIPKVRGLLKEGKLKIPQQFDNLLKEMGEMTYSTTKDDKVTSKRIGVDLVDALLLALTTQDSARSRFGIVVDSYG